MKIPIKFFYDDEDDNLLICLEGKEVKETVEIGDWLFDINHNNELVGIQILDASKVLSIKSKQEVKK